MVVETKSLLSGLGVVLGFAVAMLIESVILTFVGIADMIVNRGN